MRRLTASALAVLVILCAACGREPTPTNVTDAEASLTAADGMQIALPETTQTPFETQAETEPETTQPPATTQPPVTTTLPPATTTTQPPATTTPQPPVTTTQPPDTTTTTQKPPVTSRFIDEELLNQPPEDGSAPFTAKYIPVYNSNAQLGEPNTKAVETRDELKNLLSSPNAEGRTISFRNTETNYIANYTDEWFETHRLIVIEMQVGSGSYRYNVRRVEYTDSGATVKVKLLCPNVCTCDIAHWLIFIELPDTRLRSGDPVEFVWA